MDRATLNQDQIALRQRPTGSPVMYQQWRSLLFLHFSCPASEVQRLVPESLTVDTFPDANGVEMAWVGLVPFRMQGVRPRGLPAFSALSAFPETNVRTYVHHKGRNPGVWFFSLDAANAMACRIARRFFALPYFEADMRVDETGDVRVYESLRVDGSGSLNMRAKFGEPSADAAPGSLEFFLVERYLLYTVRNRRLYSGRVHHCPYPLRQVEEVGGSETLVEAAGLFPRAYGHQIASDGVDVEVFKLSEV